MSLINTAEVLLKCQTPLQQLLEDINFQRNKEMRQLLKNDCGFVFLQGTTYWTDLFVRHFLFQSEPMRSIDSDDLLFFVRKKHVKSSSRHTPKFETEIDVFRKDSRKLPIGDPDIDWEETVYLNMVIHQFDYTLTLAICTRTSPKELQVLRRHSQRVYASPSRRKMDTKGDSEEITYPHICFMVDNFDEVFSDILVRDGEMVCVELVANDKDGTVQGVIFLGSIRYDALKKVYDARQSSLSSKVAQRMTFGLFSNSNNVQTRCEFVRMKGPQGKGHAEMAVTKPKGSGIETPTSEPGFTATDMWDDCLDDENEYVFMHNYRRRLSDPSANLSNVSRCVWRTKGSAGDYSNTSFNSNPSSSIKARSENDGLDLLGSGISEIEAGDLRDDVQSTAFSITKNPHFDQLTYSNKNQNSEICKTSDLLIKSNNNDTKPAVVNSDINKLISTKNHETDRSKIQIQIQTVTDTNSDTHNAVKNPKSITREIKNSLALTPIPNTIVTNSNSAMFCSMSGKSRGGKLKKSWIISKHKKHIPEMSEIYGPTFESTTSRSSSPAAASVHLNKKTSSKALHIKPSEATLRLTSELRKNNKHTLNDCNRSHWRRSSSPLNAEETNLSKQKSDQKKPKGKQNNQLSENAITTNKAKAKFNKNKLLLKVSPKKIKVIPEQKNTDNSAKDTNTKTWNSETDPFNSFVNIQMKQMKSVEDEYEMADDAITLSNIDYNETNQDSTTTMTIANNNTSNNMDNACGFEELPVVEVTQCSTTNYYNCFNINKSSQHHTVSNKIEDNILLQNLQLCDHRMEESNCKNKEEECKNMNYKITKNTNATANALGKRSNHTRSLYDRAINLVPKHRTADGTNIYYWCDFPKQALKELDDGVYNPLWASHGFCQSYHFWKEHKRQQSIPLNAFLTYVTLPWWSIAKDILDHREAPILTF